MEWLKSLSVMGNIYFWLGILSTAFLIVQIVLMCISSAGSDLDVDGDGDIDVDDVDGDSGVSIFTVKSLTAFFAVGSWAGLLTYLLIAEKLQWVSVIVAIVAGIIAMFAVVLIMRAIVRLQCNGNLQPEKLVGQRATVYVSVPASRLGRGKITMVAQGRFTEFDAMTDSDTKLAVDEAVEIVSVEEDCVIVKKPSVSTSSVQE